MARKKPHDKALYFSVKNANPKTLRKIKKEWDKIINSFPYITSSTLISYSKRVEDDCK